MSEIWYNGILALPWKRIALFKTGRDAHEAAGGLFKRPDAL